MADTDTAEKPKEDFYSSLSGLSDAMGPVADPMVRLLREKEKSTQTEMEQKASREASSYSGKAAAASQFADAQKQAFKGYENMPARPKDVITQDTQQGLQGLAMLLPVAGLFLGAKGATSGVNAMNAMTGVLTGYKTGNQDRIAFETKKYENSIKEWENNYKIAKDGIDRAIELAKTNYQSGVAAAEAAAHKIGSVELAAMTRNKSLGEIQTIMNKIGQDYQTHKNKLEELTTRQSTAFSRTTPAPIKILKDGKTVYADRSGNPILDKEGQSIVAPDTRTASAETRYSFNVAESMGQSIQDLKNVQLLPKDSVLGSFAGITGSDANSISNGLRNAFARTVTDEDNRIFEQVVSGLEANMARSLGGGYASSTSGKNIEAYRSQIAREGDSPVAKAIFLARMRQELDTLSDYFEVRPGAGPFVPVVKKYQQILHDAVPFTVDDVIRARGNVQSLPIGSEGEAQRRTAQPSAQPKIATQEDVVATANARFGGDVMKAEKALRERGFKIQGD
jgi:hypothetical protein